MTERYDSSDPKAVKRRREEAEFAEKQEDRDFRWIMSDIKGRRFMASLLMTCGCDPRRTETGFTGNSRSFFNEGMQQIGLKVQSRMINLCPDEYMQMMREIFVPKVDK